MECAKSEDLFIVKCEKNMTITNMTAMQKWLCEMKANGVVVLPKDVSIIAVPKNVKVIY